MTFTWDEHKAEKVLAKHGIDFNNIIGIFNDPHAVEYIDEKHSTDCELRYVIIGLTPYGLTYLSFAELSEDEVRFITARLAEKWMVAEYEENRQRH